MSSIHGRNGFGSISGTTQQQYNAPDISTVNCMMNCVLAWKGTEISIDIDMRQWYVLGRECSRQGQNVAISFNNFVIPVYHHVLEQCVSHFICCVNDCS